MMADSVRIGFERATVNVALDRLLPTRPVATQFKATEKYKRILASIREVGLVEPLVVYPAKGKSTGSFILLDGHIRLEALREIGKTDASCVVSIDDEAYTYNLHVNRLSPFHEHFMLVKALEAGVSEERLARALVVDVKRLREKCDLLRGICPEAVEVLQKHDVAATALYYFRKVLATRQIAMAQAMIDTGNYTRSYAFALCAATPRELLVDPDGGRDAEGLAPVDVTRIQKETGVLERDVQVVKEDLGQNSLNLAVVRAYLVKLLGNAQVARFLSKRHPELLDQFQKIVETESIEG